MGLPFAESRRDGFESCWCGSKEYVDFVEGEWWDFGILKFVRCSDCGTIRQVDVPADEKLYQHEYWSVCFEQRGYKERAGVTINRQFWELHGEGLVDRELEQGGSRKLLDVGCGLGEMLYTFKDRGWSVLGCDLGERPYQAALDSGLIANDEVRLGVETCITTADGPFDLTILWHVLEHCRKPLETLDRLKALMKSDGLIAIGCPDCDKTEPEVIAPTPEDIPFADYTIRSDHIWYWTQDQAVSMFQQAGFKVHRMENALEWYQNPNAWFSWIGL